MRVLKTPNFAKQYKKLKPNQKEDADTALREIIQTPKIGVKKTGDLSGVLVHKFKMVNQLTLIAYAFEEGALILIFIAIGPHENFYRGLKKSKKLP